MIDDGNAQLRLISGLNIIHNDLTERNLIVQDGHLYFIDFDEASFEFQNNGNYCQFRDSTDEMRERSIANKIDEEKGKRKMDENEDKAVKRERIKEAISLSSNIYSI